MPTKQEQTQELIADVREMLKAAGGDNPDRDVQLALLLRIAKALEKSSLK